MYGFYVHREAIPWRLVLKEGGRRPPEVVESDWQLTRRRAPEDTNEDVRRAVDEHGYCLFKIGGTFEEVRRDLERLRRGRRAAAIE